MATFDELDSQLSAAARTRTGRDSDDWVKGYKQGSFRGVEFFIKGASNSGGRRVSVFEYPNNDQVGYEDLGAKKRGFNFTAYIIGANYFDHREQLIAALDGKGAGKLVHPYRGIFEAIVTDWEEVETTEEGRVARFNITAVQYKVQELTKVTANPKAETFTQKTNMLDNILEWFDGAYKIAQKPVKVVQDATDAAAEALQVMTAAKNLAYSVSDFQREVSNLRGKLTEFILTAENIGGQLMQLVDFGTDIDSATAENSSEQLEELQKIYEGLYNNNTKTPDEIYTAADYPATTINNLMAQTIVACSYGLISTIEYETIEQAEDIQNNYFPFLDSILDNADTSDDVYAAARDAKAAAVEYLDQSILNLSQVIEYPIIETATVLRLCNEIYGTATEELQESILSRNSIENPLFLTTSVKVVVSE